MIPLDAAAATTTIRKTAFSLFSKFVLAFEFLDSAVFVCMWQAI